MAEGASLDPSLDWKRVKSMAPHLKMYQCDVGDGHLSVFVGQEPNAAGEDKWHLSISHRSSLLVTAAGNPMPGRFPTWDEMKDARYRFMSRHVWIAILLPPPTDYLNVCRTCFHLHQVDDPGLL